MTDFKTYKKDPDSTLDYGVDWVNWLSDGEIITVSEWVVQKGIAQVSESNDATTAKTFISGGLNGRAYTLTNRITTNQGRIDDRTMLIKCEDR